MIVGFIPALKDGAFSLYFRNRKRGQGNAGTAMRAGTERGSDAFSVPLLVGVGLGLLQLDVELLLEVGVLGAVAIEVAL